MPSPFPGMNPYIENPYVWKDFHDSFLPFVRELLTPQVRPNFFVRVNDFVYISSVESEESRALGRPGVAITKTMPLVGDDGEGGVALAAPAFVGVPEIVEDEHSPFLEIVDLKSKEVVTVIELLSPSNKESGEHRTQYLSKARSVLASQATLVEIDLLRGGPRMPWPRMPVCDYCIIVSRYEDRSRKKARAGIWSVGLRDPLPPIPIPLLPGFPHATLDIKAGLDRVYDSAAYADYIYKELPTPRLKAEDQAWADEILRTSK